ncbi:polysaccharide deacetylase family protein [Rubellimicrobium arenae]|uniref:polysaccharide deacetylase family protein n=1 Tax=Rubellimicrobium arenae TaxID=2817372 RepID=UPI001FEFB320|nr:polysaccharide deacetylase family protein [Rubellimicrobium arenae]
MDAGALVRAFATGAPVHAVNFHNTPRHRAAEYDRELAALAERFVAATEDDLATYLATGDWPRRRPGVVIALYNGYRNNFDVVRPLLEKHGLHGWFFVASGYVDCPPDEQLAFGAAHALRTVKDEYPDGRYALGWDEIRTLERAGHVIASHTRSHTRVALDDAAALEAEIVGSQADFVRELGHPVRAFAWLSGGAYGENPLADAAVDRAGYEFLFSNFRIQRLPGAPDLRPGA